MTKSVDVSVVIPTYNCLEFLGAALESIKIQNVDNIEVLIADDGSTDGTWDWLQEQQQQDNRIIPIKLGGFGPSKARNLCMRKAKGEFIAFLDADDIWYQDKLSKQLEYMQTHPDVVLSFTDFRHVSMNGDDLGGCFQYWPRFRRLAWRQKGYRILRNAVASIYSENIVGTSTVMMRRDVLGMIEGFDEELPSAEDWDFWLMLSSSGKVAFTEEIEMDYLMRPNSETSKVEKRLEAMEIIMQRFEKMAWKQDPSVKRLTRARYCTAKAEGYRAEGEKLKAFKSHFRAFYMKPDSRALRSLLADGKSLITN